MEQDTMTTALDLAYRERTAVSPPSITAPLRINTAVPTDQMEMLPGLVQQHIAREAAILGRDEFQGLRTCSKYWELICNCETTAISCSPNELSKAILFMNKLPNISKLTIIERGNHSKISKIPGDALSTFNKRLTHLVITGEPEVTRGSAPQMQLENICELLPTNWSFSLHSLHLNNCILTKNAVNPFSSPDFVCRNLPVLSSLRLSRFDTGLDILDLSGCTAMRKLVCNSSNIRSLILTGCTSIEHLGCQWNRLTTLDLSACAALTDLECDQNNLESLDVSSCLKLRSLSCPRNRLTLLQLPCPEQLRRNQTRPLSSDPDAKPGSGACMQLPLQQLDCSGNPLTALNLEAFSDLKLLDCEGTGLLTLELPATGCLYWLSCPSMTNHGDLVVLGGASVEHLSCDSNIFPFLPLGLRSQLVQLTMHDGDVSFKLSGFEKLEKLLCRLGPFGSIDLTGCSDVELDVSYTSEDVFPTIMGKSAVRILKISRVSPQPLDLSEFTELRELHYTTSFRDDMDFSQPNLLRILRISSNNHYGEDEEASSINLSGCLSLTELHCSNLCGLLELDVSACTSLTALTCRHSSVRSLDVSCCPDLVSLDVSRCSFLESLCTANCSKLLSVETKDCPKLVQVQLESRGVECAAATDVRPKGSA